MLENIDSATSDIQEQFTEEVSTAIADANDAVTSIRNNVTNFLDSGELRLRKLENEGAEAIYATRVARINANSAANAATTAAAQAQAIIDAGDAVTTWNGRAGTVTPQAGDYSANQITYKDTNVDEAISSNDSQILIAQNNITTLQSGLSALRTELTSLIAYEDVTVTVSYEAGTIGSRGAAISCGTTVKSGYTYIGMFIINHTNTSNFSISLSRNNSTNNAMLLVYRATGNAVSNAAVDVRKVWIKNISAT